jgi:hypothetical protein
MMFFYTLSAGRIPSPKHALRSWRSYCKIFPAWILHRIMKGLFGRLYNTALKDYASDGHRFDRSRSILWTEPTAMEPLVATRGCNPTSKTRENSR